MSWLTGDDNRANINNNETKRANRHRRHSVNKVTAVQCSCECSPHRDGDIPTSWKMNFVPSCTIIYLLTEGRITTLSPIHGPHCVLCSKVKWSSLSARSFSHATFVQSGMSRVYEEPQAVRENTSWLSWRR